MLSKSNLQEGGISQPYRKLLRKSNTKFFVNGFTVAHFAGCAILFKKDTFYPDISVKSLYLHHTRRGLQDQVVEGKQGWVFCHAPHFVVLLPSGQKAFTVLSLHRFASLFFLFLSPAHGMELLLFISWDAR